MAKKDTSGRIVAGGWTPCVEALLAAQDGAVGWVGCKLSCTAGSQGVDGAAKELGTRASETGSGKNESSRNCNSHGGRERQGPGRRTGLSDQSREEQGARMWRARANAPKPHVRGAFRARKGSGRDSVLVAACKREAGVRAWGVMVRRG